MTEQLKYVLKSCYNIKTKYYKVIIRKRLPSYVVRYLHTYCEL